MMIPKSAVALNYSSIFPAGFPVDRGRGVREPRYGPHSICNVGPHLAGDPHETPHSVSERHIHNGFILIGVTEVHR